MIGLVPFFRAVDSNGNPFVSPRLYTFLTATTTPQATYTTPGLSVSHGAYVQGDSNGLLPAFYLDPAKVYRVQLRVSPYTDAIAGYDFDPITIFTANDLQVALSGAVTTDLDTYLERLPMLAENYRQSGYTDTQTLTDAFAAWLAQGGGKLELDHARVYDRGAITSNLTFSILFNIANNGNGLRNAVLEGNGATIKISTGGAATLNSLLYFYNVRNLVIRNLTLWDAGTVDGTHGAQGIVLDSSGSLPTQGITFENVRGFGLNADVVLSSSAPTNRIAGIHFGGGCISDTCFYGVSANENGDAVTGFLRCINNVRPIIAYGIRGWDFHVRSEHDGSGIASQVGVLIKRAAQDCRNNRIVADFAGVLHPSVALMCLEHQPTAATSIIDGTELIANVEKGATDPHSTFAFALRSQIDSTYEETATAFTASITNTDETVTPAIPMGNFVVGQAITGTGIQAGSTIASIGASTFELSLPATATNATASLTLKTKNVWSNIKLGGFLNGIKALKCFVGAITSYDAHLDGHLSVLPSTKFTLQTGIVLRRNGAGLHGSATYDPASLIDGAGATTTVTVTGAELGDYAEASFGVDLAGIGLTAYVSAADTVGVRFQNETTGTVDLASSTLRAKVTKGFQA